MTGLKQISNLNYLVAVPLFVMSYHIFNFYETEPWVIRLGLAASFDVMVVVCFYLLKDEFISKVKIARQVTWATLVILIGFQLYVNIWAYADLHWFRALISGSIFPLVVGLISYIAMIREKTLETEVAQQQKKQSVLKQLESVRDPAMIAALAEDRPYRDKRVDKTEVIKAYHNAKTETNPKPNIYGPLREIFLGSTNMKSVDRWLEKLDEGQAP